METIFTPNAPKPIGHYAQALVHEGMIYVSGQVAFDAVAKQKRIDSIEEQTKQALANVVEIVRAGGGDADRIIKTTVFLSDMALWGKVNEAYGEFFGEHRPARSVLPIGEIPGGFLIEIEAVAAAAR